MNITQEQKNFIESIIIECSGYRGNEHLLDKFCDEIIRRAYNLISKPNDLENSRVYVKRIANFAIMEVVKSSKEAADLNKAVPVVSVDSIEQISSAANYEFDENGDIIINYDISFEEISEKIDTLTKKQIKNIQNVILNLEKDDNTVNYKEIFELRYVSGLNNTEIGEKLELQESEVDKRLLLMLNSVRKEVFSA